MVGTNSKIPVIMTAMAATIEVAPAAKDTPRAVIPAETKVSPAPIPSIPNPSSTNAPASPSIGMIKGFNNNPANPITVNAPAKTISPFAISVQLIVERDFRVGAIAAMATEAIRRAAAPPMVLFIKLSPIARIARDPPIANKPFSISPDFISLKSESTLATILRDAAAISIPVAFSTEPFGIIFIAKANSAIAIPIAVRPLVMLGHSILLMSDSTDANIFIEAEISNKDNPVRTTCFALPAIFSNIETSKSKAPTAERPFPMSCQLIPEKSLHAEANIFMEMASAISPIEPLIIFEPVLVIT